MREGRLVFGLSLIGGDKRDPDCDIETAKEYETNIAREHLYQITSEKGNPTFHSLSTVLEALGVHLQFVASEPLKSV